MAMSQSMSSGNTPSSIFLAALAITLAAFLLFVGLGPDRLPFPPHAEFSDAVTSHWSSAYFLRQSVLQEGVLPLWRPQIMSGQPFAANPLNKVWYPPQWMVLALPPALHLNLLLWLHLFIAGSGAWSWGRISGLDRWPAALTGFGYAFAPRLMVTVGAGHLDLVYAAAWMPWLLWALYRLTRNPPARHAELWLSVFVAMCFLADVRLSLYAFILAGAYLVWRQRETRASLRAVSARVGVAALLALGLTAFQWIALLLYRSDLSRADMSLEDAAINSLTAGRWLSLLFGEHGGSWETLVYVGISALTLAIAALVMRPSWFWIGALIVIIMYAMGDEFVFWTALNRLIPPLRWWRGPARVWLVAMLIWPYLAGWGAQLLAERPPDRRIARLSATGVLGGGIACGAVSAVLLGDALEWTAIVGIFFLPVTALWILLATLGLLSRRAIMIGFALIVIVDVAWIDLTLVDGRSRREWLDPHRVLAEYLHDTGATRVYSPSYSLPQQAAARWQIAQFDGVDPFQRADYVAAFEAATGVKTTGYSVTLPAYELDEEVTASGTDDDGKRSELEIISIANMGAPIDAELLGQWLVTHVVSAFEIEAEGLVFDTQIGGAYVYRNTRAPDVSLTWDGPNRVTINAAEPLAGPVYAVANGRWQDADSRQPGLPGALATPVTLTYDTSEVLYSALAMAVLVALAGGVWWVTVRD